MIQPDSPVKATEGGSLLAVRVTPRSRESGVEGVQNGRLQVRVQSPPERGRANEECLQVLAACLGLPRSRLELRRGGTGREKLVLVRGLSPGEVLERLGH